MTTVDKAAAVDKAALLAKRVGDTVPFEIADVGPVVIRGLSRAEVLELRGAGGAAYECRLLALAIVDPPLTVEDVATWQANGPAGEFEELTTAVAELSGMGAGSAKAAYLRFRERLGD